MSEVFFQLKVFFLTLSLGVLAGLIFHYYQNIVRLGRINRFILYVLDLAIWLLMLVLVFMLMVMINAAEMRVYVLAAWGLGAAIYYLAGVPHTSTAIKSLAQITVAVIHNVFGALLKPMHWACTRVKYVFSRKDMTPPEK